MRFRSSAVVPLNALIRRSSRRFRVLTFTMALLAMTLLTGSALYAQSADPAAQLANTRQALSELNARISTSVSVGTPWNTQTRTLLSARHDLVARVLRDDPANARTYALDPQLRTTLLAADSSASTLIEQDSAITGELVGSVADDFDHHTSTMQYVLHAYTRDTDLSFAKAIPGIDRMLHRQVTVRGVGLPEIMAADSLADATSAEVEQSASVRTAADCAASPAASPAPATCSTTGVQSIAVLLVTFPGNTPAFPTGLDQAAYWNKQLFGANPSVNGFWNEVSYGQTSATGNVFGPFALSQSYDCTTTSAMQTAAIAAATGTVDFTQYNRIMIVFPATNSCYFSGLANMGCLGASSTINHQYSVVWLSIFPSYNGNTQTWGVASHELGHNLGLGHANTLDFGSITLGPFDFVASNPGTVSGDPPPSGDTGASGPPAPIAAVNTEYGDPFSVMGFAGYAGPYSAEHRAKLLGWIPQSDERDITASGTYTLVPAENSSGLRALHVQRDPISSSWLWIEFHQASGYYTAANVANFPGNTLTNGALIHYETPSLDAQHTYLLDMTPVAVSNNFLDGTLAPGKSWSDPYSLLTLTAGTQTSSSLGVSVNYDTPCATLSLSSSVLSAAGGTANLIIAAPSTCSWSATSNASWISFPGVTSGSGNATIPFTYNANTAVAQRNSYITAQRQSVPIVQPGTSISITGLSPSVGSSATNVLVPFTLSVNDSLGLSDWTEIVFDLAGSGTPDCEIIINQSGSSTFLTLITNGSGSGILAGSTGTQSNSSCTLSAAGSSNVTSGNSATLTVDLSFPSTFLGTHSASAQAYSSANKSGTATIPLGYWTVGTVSGPTSVSSFSISPSTVTAGGSATLNFTLSAAAPTGGASVTLASSNGSAFPVAGSFTIPAGQTTGSFSTPAGTVSAPTLVTVTASYNSSSQQAQVTINPISAPTITFTVPNHTYGDAPFTVAATSNSPGAIAYSVVSGPATISGSTVTLNGTGTVVLQASQAASGSYSAITQTATFTVASGAPTITFTVLNHTYGDAAFTVSATTNSSGAISYSVLSGPATISGSTVTLTGTGTVVLQASQAAAGSYTLGTQTASFTVATESQTITFTAPTSPVTYGISPITLVATGGASGNAVVFSVLSGPASVSGGTLTITGAGTVVVAADQPGNTNYAAATEVTQSIVINQASQTITFTAPTSPVTYGVSPITLVATGGGSGNAVVFSVVSGPGSVSGSTLTITGVGTVVVAANQAGNSNYAAAAQVTQSIVVNQATPTITFTVPNHTYGDAPFTVSATSNSSGAMTYSVVSGPATISSATVTLTGVGTVVLQASQAAAGNYAAGSKTASFTVAGQAPTITFTVSNHTYGDAPFSVSATSNSSGTLTYSVVSGPATISGSTVTLTGAGTVVLQASQAAAGNYAAGTQNASVTVATESQTITFATPTSPVTYGVVPITLSASSTSGLTVTFSVLSGPASVSGGTLTITGAGTVVVAADQPGNTNYAAATEVTHSITVNKITPTAGLTASPNPILVQNALTLTATVASSVSMPTGSVVFSDGSTALGTVALSSGVATLTVSTLAVGSHSLTAAYSGDGNFISVVSAAVSETVQDFTLTIGGSGGSQTVQPGGTATYTLPMSPSGGTTFPAAVTFSASGLPAGFTATFSPSSLASGSSATNVTLTVQVPQAAMMEKSRQPGRGLPLVALGMLLLPFAGGIRRSSKRLRRLTFILILLAGIGGVATLTGCGGGSSGGGGGGSQPQTYNITVTATSGTLSHTTIVTLTVQ